VSAEWIRAAHSPDGRVEAWELRHHSGALLAEMDVRLDEMRWWAGRYRTVRSVGVEPWPYTIARHRRELRAFRARLYATLRDIAT
jgi:hypothetical protein